MLQADLDLSCWSKATHKVLGGPWQRRSQQIPVLVPLKVQQNLPRYFAEHLTPQEKRIKAMKILLSLLCHLSKLHVLIQESTLSASPLRFLDWHPFTPNRTGHSCFCVQLLFATIAIIAAKIPSLCHLFSCLFPARL